MSAPAPAPEPSVSAAAAERFLATVARLAAGCGVTRLADITGLDTLGLPVWQAVRPAGKALSVHQGKAATAVGAKTGALCEAIESHCAENAPADGPCCRFEELPVAARASDPADFARRREEPPDAGAVPWCLADDLIGGGAFHLPHDLVSLDFTAARRSAFDRSSAGLGLGADEDAAAAVSLRELIERDAVGEWQRRPLPERMEASVAPDTIAYSWFGVWRERLARLGIDVAAFAVPTVVDVPVAVVWIGGGEAFGPGYRSFSGSACDADPERALFKALAEAAQSRLTFIAGVRDDILPSHYRPAASLLPAACAAARLHWDEQRRRDADALALARKLAASGYRQVAVKRIDAGFEGVAVTKAFVPGLGSLKRTRRAAR